MKKTILHILMFFTFLPTCISQSFTTTLSKSYKSNFCGEESFSFTFDRDADVILIKDNYLGESEGFYSRMTTSEFTNEGFYLETWTPSFFLEEHGSSDYYEIEKHWYRIFYDKKGGNLLCILEFRQVGDQLDVENGKYYLTEIGKKYFCTK